jgi:glucokinase
MSEGPQAIGIDAGGTKVLALRVGPDARVFGHATRPTPADDPEETVLTLVGAGHDVLTPDVIAVGLGAAGLVEDDAGTMRYAPNISWRDLSLRDRMRDAFGLPVRVDNDCATAAYGELRAGAARGFRHVLYVGVGTGIGGGLIVDGRVYRGANGFAAEIGHIVVEPDGPACGCGNRGCWETVASGSAITREGRVAATRHTHSAIAEFAGGDPDVVSGSLVTKAAGEGDPTAMGILAEVGTRLGEGIAGLVNVLDPQLVVVGGGAGSAGDLLLDPARAAFRRCVEGVAHRPDVPIVLAALGDRAAAIGAALLALEDLA